MQNSWALTRAIDAQLSLMPTTKVERDAARGRNRAHVVDRFTIEKMIGGFHKIWFGEKA
jgi:hypothetical protein